MQYTSGFLDGTNIYVRWLSRNQRDYYNGHQKKGDLLGLVLLRLVARDKDVLQSGGLYGHVTLAFNFRTFKTIILQHCVKAMVITVPNGLMVAWTPFEEISVRHDVQLNGPSAGSRTL